MKLLRPFAGIVFALVSVASLAACGPSAHSEKSDKSRPIVQIYPNATSARMFVHSWGRFEAGKFVSEERWLNPPNGYQLSKAQVDRFKGSLRNAPVPEALAACFVPHHFFRFYDERGRQVGEVSICFCCIGAQSEPQLVSGEDRMLSADFDSIAKLVKELGAPTNVDCGKDEDWFK